MKRTIFRTALLACLACLAMTGTAFAASAQQEQAAESLHELGLFLGTGTDTDGNPVYELDAVPTRNQAVIMLVRLLGKEDEALSGDWTIPFTDVAKGSLSSYYIGYAYAHGLTKGTTATTYSGRANVNRNQYLLFLMRALGYDREETGYDQNNQPVTISMTTAQAGEQAVKLGMDDGTAGSAVTRGDVALLSCRALDTFLYTVTPDAATLRESLGLGQSPAITDLPVAVTSGKADSYEKAYAAIQPDQDYTRVRQELSVPGGTVVSFVWGGLPHGNVEHLRHLEQDGSWHILPLPTLSVWNERAQPDLLSYDESTGLLTYEATIAPGQTGIVGEPVRRVGTYQYTYDVNSHTCTVTERERADVFVEESVLRLYDSLADAPLESGTYNVGRGKFDSAADARAFVESELEGELREWPVEGGAVLLYRPGRIAYLADEGTLYQLPIPGNETIAHVAADSVTYDPDTKSVAFDVEVQQKLTGSSQGARTYRCTYVLGGEKIAIQEFSRAVGAVGEDGATVWKEVT